MLYQMLSCLLMIWSVLNVQGVELKKKSFIYDNKGLAKVNFFAKVSWTYVECMKHCQKMGGRSPPVRNKKELDDMKGMLNDLRAFPPFPESLFLSVTCDEGGNGFNQKTLEPKDNQEAKDGLWRDYYTGEKLENYNETWGEENCEDMFYCAHVFVKDSKESLDWYSLPCSQMMDGTYTPCLSSSPSDPMNQTLLSSCCLWLVTATTYAHTF